MEKRFNIPKNLRRRGFGSGRRIKKETQKQLAVIENVQSMIEEGRQYISDESKYGVWEEFVKRRTRGVYRGKELKHILKIVSLIRNGESKWKIKEEFDNQGHSGSSEALVLGCLINIFGIGEEFYNYLSNSNIPYSQVVKEYGIVEDDDNKEDLREIVITEDVVVKGLEFIANHPNMEYYELVHNLRGLGCNFSMKEVSKQFPEIKNRNIGDLCYDLINGNIGAAAKVLVNCMCDKYSLSYCKEVFFTRSVGSIYDFLENVKNKGKIKNE